MDESSSGPIGTLRGGRSSVLVKEASIFVVGDAPSVEIKFEEILWLRSENRSAISTVGYGDRADPYTFRFAFDTVAQNDKLLDEVEQRLPSGATRIVTSKSLAARLWAPALGVSASAYFAILALRDAIKRADWQAAVTAVALMCLGVFCVFTLVRRLRLPGQVTLITPSARGALADST